MLDSSNENENMTAKEFIIVVIKETRNESFPFKKHPEKEN